MEQASALEESQIPSRLPKSVEDLGWFERIARASGRGEGPVTVRREDLRKMLSALITAMAARERPGAAAPRSS